MWKAGTRQTEKLRECRVWRDGQSVTTALAGMHAGATSHGNTMPAILDAWRAYATLGEICDALRDVFGTYQERSVL